LRRPWAATAALHRLAGSITVFDAVGLSVFVVTGASKALDFGLSAAQLVILGTITGVERNAARRTDPSDPFRAEHPWERLEVLPMTRLCTPCLYLTESHRAARSGETEALEVGGSRCGSGRWIGRAQSGQRDHNH
jgi:hypothetical protein